MQRLPPVHRRDSGACPDTRRSNRPCATTLSTHSVSPVSMSLLTLNPVDPPWYGPVCPVVWEGRCREAPPLSRSIPKTRPLAARINFDLGVVHTIKKRRDKAVAFYRKARTIADALGNTTLLSKIDAAVAAMR